jgi:hypothetical protein
VTAGQVSLLFSYTAQTAWSPSCWSIFYFNNRITTFGMIRPSLKRGTRQLKNIRHITVR